jgi:hypothetical protein
MNISVNHNECINLREIKRLHGYNTLSNPIKIITLSLSHLRKEMDTQATT